MSLLDVLRSFVSSDPGRAGQTDTVREIMHELEALPPDRARYLAAFAYVLGRVANADRVVDGAETRTMERLVGEVAQLDTAQAALVVGIATRQNRLFGGTEDYLVTRELFEVSTPEQRDQVLRCAFAVAAADGSISSAEEAQLRQISSELGMSGDDYVRVRSAYNDQRSVVQLMRATQRT